jgi:hypothetical protein
LAYLFRQFLPDVALAIITPIPLVKKGNIENFHFLWTDIIVFGQRFNIPVFDMWKVFNFEKGYSSELMNSYVGDSGKLNAVGHAKISNQLHTFIVEKFSDLVQ